MQAMRHRLATLAGRAAYAIRKQTVEPVFGIIKSVMGFRQFLFCAVCAKSRVNGTWFVWPGMSSAWQYYVQKLDKARKYRENTQIRVKSRLSCLFFKHF